MAPLHIDPERSAPPDEGRRRFLTTVTTVTLATAAGAMSLFNMIFLKPRVIYGSSSKVRVGRPNAFPQGSYLDLPAARLMVRRDGNRFAAISTVCTHLGCTVRATDVGFDCPCHGSTYDQQGINMGGPAPKPLAWYRISLTPEGELEVDKSDIVPFNTYLEVAS